MEKTVSIAYGENSRLVRVPAANLAWVVGPKEVPPVPDVAAAVHDAVRAPIGSPTLTELVARYGTRTVVLVDDGTRSTPQRQILPALLDELNAAGVPDGEITAVIALGTHREMNPAERLQRFGAEVIERIQVLNLSTDPADFVDAGITPSGVPIQVAKIYVESDISIAVGNIIPHMYAGWGGGAKMVQPGVSSPLTTAKTHLLAGPRVYELLGKADNPVRDEMETIARQTGLKFIVNVVLTPSLQVCAVVAGDLVKAHRAGVKIAEPIFTVEVDERPDIVIASSYPADRDFWQGAKPLNNCGMLVKDGGTLILAHPAPEGIAQDHPALLELGLTDPEVVLRKVDAQQIEDGVAVACYLALCRTRQRAHIMMVSDGIAADEGARIGFECLPDLDTAIERALARHGKDARIGIVTHGGDIVGRIRGQQS